MSIALRVLEVSQKRKDYVSRVSCFLFMLCLSILCIFAAGIGSASAAKSTLEFQQCEGNTCSALKNNIISGSFTKGDTLNLRIVATNPEKAPIYSVQSWVKFSPLFFSASGLSADNSAFELAAPGEFKVKNDVGEIRIGRAVTGGFVETEKIIVADFVLEVKKNVNGAALDFMEFKANDIGKTALVTIGNNIPANIISSNPASLRFESLKSANSFTTPANVETTQNGQDVYGVNNNLNGSSNQSGNGQENTTQTQIATETQNIISADIPRPDGFRSRTYSDGRAEHLWKQGEDSRIKGYYLYYSATSGMYMHRRDMGKTNSYRFPNDFFEKGKRMYFAVQAYTQDGTLSDFSDETYVTIGTEGSESHPFFEQIFPDAKVSGEDANNTYYGADVTGNTNSSSSENLPTPKTSPQSGLKIPFHWFILMGGLVLFFAGRMVLKEEK